MNVNKRDNSKKNLNTTKNLKKNNEKIVVPNAQEIIKECFTDFQYECMVLGIHNFIRDD